MLANKFGFGWYRTEESSYQQSAIAGGIYSMARHACRYSWSWLESLTIVNEAIPQRRKWENAYYEGVWRKHHNGALDRVSKAIDTNLDPRTKSRRVLPPEQVLALVETGLWRYGCPIHLCRRGCGSRKRIKGWCSILFPVSYLYVSILFSRHNGSRSSRGLIYVEWRDQG